MEKQERDVIIFCDESHKQFFEEQIVNCRYQDVYHMALIYCLGISQDTRTHIDRIYDFKEGLVKPECLQEGWITSGSERIVRMAFNLYCNGTPSTNLFNNLEEKLRECRNYNAEVLFCCSYAPYFYQAIKLRYPEYC